jgi:hypothetical protein
MKNTGFCFICLLMFFSAALYAQTRDRKAVVATHNSSKNCRVFLNGKLLNYPQPFYPIEAKMANVAGKVQAIVEIDESGKVIEIDNILGSEMLRKSATEAAFKARFSPTLCDGKASKAVGVIIFNYTTIALTNEYFKPTRIEELSDLTPDSNFYEVVLYLTENYRIAFGYADRKFHAEMPLTKGDFVQFLGQTLKLLESRANLAQKNLRQIQLYQAYNPYQLREVEFNPTAPFIEALKTLSGKYGIVLAEKDGKFAGNMPMKKAEIIQIWGDIFGHEPIPINFLSDRNNEREMSRGDFALYLKESLDVLTYKVLP